jgi:polygalacturonase
VPVILLCAFAVAISGCNTSQRSTAKLKVTDFGAAGDGKTLDTRAFQRALDACAASGGGEVSVPAGNFLIGSVIVSSNTTLRIEKDATLTGSPDKSDYPLMTVRWEGEWRDGHRALIFAEHANHVAVVGEGKIVGDPQIGFLRNPRGPCIFEAIECSDVRVEGISISFVRMWSVHPTLCDGVVVKGVTIRSEPRQSNGDGIDVDSCTNVRIENCDIDTGDDAIALKSGRGLDAVKAGTPTKDVLISGCKLGSTFAAVAVGTEMSGGISGVRIEHCTFTRGVNGVYIKSRTGRGGFMQDIQGSDIDVTADVQNFLNIDLVNKGIPASQPVTGDDAYPRVGNIRFERVRSKADTLVRATAVAKQRPVEGLVLRDITGTCRRPILVSNVNSLDVQNVEITGYDGPLIATAATRPSATRANSQ